MQKRDLSLGAGLYIALVVAAGMVAIGLAAYQVITGWFSTGWLVLCAITLLASFFSIKLPSINARISVSEAFVFAAVLLYGAAPATLIVALDTVVLTSWKRGTARARLRALFNMSACAAGILGAAYLFETLLPPVSSMPSLEEVVLPVLALGVAYFAINSSLVAVAVAFESGRPAHLVWAQNFAWLGLSYLGAASLAALLVTYARNIDLTSLVIIVPLLIMPYLTLRTSLGRLDDARRHVEQLNGLYFSTIEALAMAVDAKDQITHGHIRRVQFYTLELAKRLGVTDAQELKGIEAAALLHDMGKLAIPEHILNKPGKLTPAEFEVMKTHAKIGADLLSSIPFPYSVVPIVRHHHENWNGKGYPDGVAATDIPLGARILSVVDCFDALNSDRPYRPKMSVEESFAILRERRGNMYDPQVVDAFIEAYPNMAEGAQTAGENARSLVPAQGELPAQSPSVLADITASAAETQTLLEVKTKVTATDDTSSAFQLLARHLGDLTGSEVCAYYEYSEQRDVLVCVSASGPGSGALLGATVSVGDRVSGWVAANRQTVTNADAALELKERLNLCSTKPKSTLSTSVLTEDALVGVLMAFSTKPDAYSSRHAYVIEQCAAALGAHIRKIRSHVQTRLSA
jgi:putative nucleotidyltransferase with HDIG domain